MMPTRAPKSSHQARELGVQRATKGVKSEPPYDGQPLSKTAVLAGVAGALVLTPAGSLGIPLGILGLWSTAQGRRRGRSLAAWGLVLGVLSIGFGLVPFPASFLWPPVFKEDRALQRFLDDVAAGRYEAARKNGTVGGTRSPEGMRRWGSLVRQRLGGGRVIGSVARIHAMPDGLHVYLVRFRKTGWELVSMMGPDRSVESSDPLSAKWLVVAIDSVPPPDAHERPKK